MKDLIWRGIGAVIAIASAVYMLRLILLKKNGMRADAEVVTVREVKKGTHIHTMRYCANGQMIDADDSAGYTQPFEIGTVKAVYYDKNKPEHFEFEEELKKNIIIMGAMAGLAVIFTIKFLLSGLK